MHKLASGVSTASCRPQFSIFTTRFAPRGHPPAPLLTLSILSLQCYRFSLKSQIWDSNCEAVGGRISNLEIGKYVESHTDSIETTTSQIGSRQPKKNALQLPIHSCRHVGQSSQYALSPITCEEINTVLWNGCTTYVCATKASNGFWDWVAYVARNCWVSRIV